MDELLAALKAALEEAGAEVPAEPGTLTSGQLDQLIPDKRLRGRAKSALIRYQREAGVDPEAAHAAPAPAPEAEPEPEPVAVAAPTVEPELEPEAAFEAPPMSAELAELHAAVAAAFEAAGVAVPADLIGFDPAGLEAQVGERKLRGNIKSALVKFKRAAEAEGWTTAPARPARTAAPEAAAPAPAPEPVAAATEPEPEAAPEPEAKPEPEPAVEPPPLSDELRPLHEALAAAFGAADVPLPDDLMGFDPGGLEEVVTDRKRRGNIKSALVKFRRAAEAEGWTARAARPAAAPRKAAAAPAPTAAAATPAAAAPAPQAI
ncbi:MAG: hypothetical protein HYU66_24785, partial [Armatimonadetes bacterium]|nr:hypothetical protein [Armatimonadota bacterium]